MPVTVNELIKQLQEYAGYGYGSARVYVRCAGFRLVDWDRDGEVVDFDSVPSTGVEEGGSGTGMVAHVIIGREEPDEVKRRMCESSRWSEPAPPRRRRPKATNTGVPKEANSDD